MKRSCFLGNSHVGCIRLGAEALRAAGRLGDHEISVFGSVGDDLQSATVEHGQILPNDPNLEKIFVSTSGGQNKVKLSDFDQIFLFMGISPVCIDSFRVRDSASQTLDFPEVSRQLLSRMFLSFESTWWIKLAKSIANENSNLNVTFLGRPFLADDSRYAKRVLRRLERNDVGFQGRVERIKRATDEYCTNSSPENLKYARPADALLESHGLFTKRKYSRDSARLLQEHDRHSKDDVRHMNAEYGQEMVAHLLGLDARQP